jgi:TonB family protein
MKRFELCKHAKYLLVLPLVAVSLELSAQSENSIGFDQVPAEKLEGWIKVTGRVLDKETKAPIENVVLYVGGRDNKARTDRHGKFLLLAKEGDVVNVFHGPMRRQSFIVKDESPKDIWMRYEHQEFAPILVKGKAIAPKKEEKATPKEVEKAPWKEPDPLEGLFAEFDVWPEYPGGMAKCMEFVSKNLRYPEAALQKRIEGWVLVSFTVGVDGTITDVETLKGVYEALDEEAMRVVRLMPKWKPCEWYGKRVPMKFTMPIEFRLKKRK